MDAIKKILVAIDFSSFSESIFSYAARLADKVNAGIYAVNVINNRDVKAIREMEARLGGGWADDLLEKEKNERLAKLKRLSARFDSVNVKVTRQVRIGEPADEIIRACLETEADILVIGPKGRTNLSNLLFGSVAEKLHRRSPVSLLSVRGEEHAGMVNKLEL